MVAGYVRSVEFKKDSNWSKSNNEVRMICRISLEFKKIQYLEKTK